VSEESQEVTIRVREIQGGGSCSFGIRPGDSWVVSGEETPPEFCAWALQAIFPFLTVLRFGGEFPWEEDKDTAVVCCPDPHNSVVFELRRTG
jgi:uncharacterized repeat protein (TIGR04076 family)